MTFLEEGGSFMYAVLGMGGLGLLIVLGLTGLAATKRRVPLAVLLVVPLMTLAVGAVGSMLDTGSAIEAVNAADAQTFPALAKSGWGVSMLPDWFARWVAAGLMALAAWGAGIGATLRSDDDSRFTPFSAAVALLFTLLFGGITAYINVSGGLPNESWAITGLLAFGGLGVSVGALRRHEWDEAFRIAGMRFASGVALILAVTWAGRAATLGADIEMSRALALASSETYGVVLAEHLALAAGIGMVSWIAITGAWCIAIANFFAELGEVVQKGTLADMTGVLALLVVMFVVRAVEHTQTDTLKAIGQLGPLSTMIEEYGYDLPGTVGVISWTEGEGDDKQEKSKVIDARPLDGGFGDIVALVETPIEGSNDKTQEWKRLYKWNGAGWDEDDTAIASAQFTQGKDVLMVVEQDVAATTLVEGLTAVGGKALLLARIADLDTNAPLEVKARQGVMIPIEIGTEIDFETALWVWSDRSKLMKGPIEWFGHDDNKAKQYERFAAAFVGTELKGVHLVADERARVSDVTAHCLPAMMEPEGEGEEQKLKKVERYCQLHKGTKEATVEKALETWTAPEVTHSKLSLDIDKTMDEELHTTLIEQQLGAFEFCADRILKPDDEGNPPMVEPEEEGGEPTPLEPVEGRLQFEMRIDREGNISSVVMGDRNEIENPNVKTCAAKRLRTIDFPERPLAEGEVEEEDYEDPKVIVTVEYSVPA